MSYSLALYQFLINIFTRPQQIYQLKKSLVSIKVLLFNHYFYLNSTKVGGNKSFSLKVYRGLILWVDSCSIVRRHNIDTINGTAMTDDLFNFLVKLSPTSHKGQEAWP